MKEHPSVIVIDWFLAHSKSYSTLTGASHLVLTIFWGKRQIDKTGKKGHERVIIKNNGKIVFTYKEAEIKYGISARRFNRAIDNLIEHGFISIVNTNPYGISTEPNLYQLENYWQDYGTKKFKERLRARKIREIGFCKYSNINEEYKNYKFKIDTGYIYFIQEGSKGLVKIGCSQNNVKSRLRQIAISTPFNLEIIGVIKSNNILKDELFYHTKFAHKRIKREWFKLNLQDMLWIKNYIKKH
ncbi:unnamed protein product [marine sediment metagenome]|uniref:Bacteriophage T5 Orf172 DNA-binding domain-containing protein n=1 Tax=marine sediment metagenome TaxID=412755 RepID=X0SIV5_9ZZZZ